MSGLKGGSTFSGIGGVDLGFERAGIRTSWQVELAAFPQRVLAARWPEVERHDDITDLDVQRLGRVDILSGGFPCQDVSVAGRREGLAGRRSGLFFDFAAIAADLKPTWIVLENVPGLLSSRGGDDFATVLGTLVELGYGVSYRVFDSQYFGVAQRRRRVFIVGYLGDAIRAAEVLFELEGSSGNLVESRRAGEDIARALTTRTGGHHDETRDSYVAATLNSGGNSGGFRTEPGEHLVIAHTLTAGGKTTGRRQEDDFNVVITHALTAEGHDASEDGTGRGTPIIVIQDARGVRDNPQNGIGISEGDGPMYTLDGTSEHAEGVFPDLRRHDDQYRGDIRDKPSLNTANNDLLLAPTLRSNVRNNSNGGSDALSKVYESMGVRKLTPLECERLQGFPDGWTCLCGAEGVTVDCTCPDTPRYKALGNAVTVAVAEWIGRRIVAVDALAKV